MNFSYDELVRLENEAMKRVEKINESERYAARRINESITPTRTPEIPKPKHISMPANLSPAKIPSILSESSGDSSLLLALVLLLSKEKTDTMLLMAIVYILM